MTRAWAGLLVCVLAAGLLVACSRSEEDLIQTSRGVGTRAERALRKPSDIGKLGPVEQWTSPDEKKDQK